MKIFWHVCNLKVSHLDPKEVTKHMVCLEVAYEEMKISRVKVHKYLSMTVYFLTSGEFQVTMVDYLKGVLEDFP